MRCANEKKRKGNPRLFPMLATIVSLSSAPLFGPICTICMPPGLCFVLVNRTSPESSNLMSFHFVVTMTPNQPVASAPGATEQARGLHRWARHSLGPLLNYQIRNLSHTDVPISSCCPAIASPYRSSRPYGHIRRPRNVHGWKAKNAGWLVEL